MPLKIAVGDSLQMKKKHPCGGDTWEVIRTGADFVIKCTSCSHQTWIARTKLEKSIKKWVKKEESDD